MHKEMTENIMATHFVQFSIHCTYPLYKISTFHKNFEAGLRLRTFAF